MKFIFTDCNHCNEGLFADFANFKTVDNYLTALTDWVGGKSTDIEKRPQFIPIDCVIKDVDTGELQWIIKGGLVASCAEEYIKQLRNKPSHIRHFMSDDILITGNGLAHELCIEWNITGMAKKKVGKKS